MSIASKLKSIEIGPHDRGALLHARAANTRCVFSLGTGGHYVDPKLAGPDSETPMECATQGGFGLIADIGGDPRDWVACGCEPPAGESEPELGQESERSNPCYSVKRPDASSSRRRRPRRGVVR